MLCGGRLPAKLEEPGSNASYVEIAEAGHEVPQINDLLPSDPAYSILSFRRVQNLHFDVFRTRDSPLRKLQTNRQNVELRMMMSSLSTAGRSAQDQILLSFRICQTNLMSIKR